MIDLEFIEEGHVYLYRGEPIPSVSAYLKARGLVNMDAIPQNALVMERARTLGKAVHRATELFDDGNLDEESVSDVISPYLEGWISFKEENRFTAYKNETPICDPLLRIGATPDRIGKLDGVMSVLDVKSGCPCKSHKVQLAAYQQVINRNYLDKWDIPEVKQRVVVYLKNNMDYDLRILPISENQKDWQTFLACITLTNYFNDLY